MAHWIIEDHGFGGRYFRCSNCHHQWWDLVTDIPTIDSCHECGAMFNNDENVYLERVDSLLSTSRTNSVLRRYDELDTTLIQLTGFNLEKLVELFAAGYMLKAPEYKILNDVLEDVTC